MSSASNPALSSLTGRYSGGWWPLIREPFTGAWQRNIDKSLKNVIGHTALYACVTLITSDIGKLRLRLVEQDKDGIWTETESSAFSPVLRKPNRYQTRIKFVEQWIVSKLLHGNTYVLKERDERGVVRALYILDPTRVKPLVAPDGSVFYQLSQDNLAGIEPVNVTVPQSEIIHDLMVALFHPLCGVSPITACGLAAAHGLGIQDHSSQFFANGANPGGILTAPGLINDETAERLKRQWEEKYGGANVGRVAVLGDGLKYEAMSVDAVDSQLIEQLKWTGEQVATCFHVPAFMIGVGPAPPYTNVQALNLQYYSQCLQSLIENLELSLDEGLGLTEVQGKTYGVEFDLDGLLRMDTATAMDVAIKAVGGSIYSPNEARKKFDMKPAKGGDSPLSQAQYYSLQALAERDADKPFSKPPALTPGRLPGEDDEPDEADEAEKDVKAQFAAGMLTLELKALPPPLPQQPLAA